MHEVLPEGKKILITGVSGQCGRGLAHVLARRNEVHGVARFSRPEVKDEIEAKGCVAWPLDMATARADRLPADFDIIIHEAVTGMSEVATLAEQNASFHVSCDFVGDLMYRNERAVFALISTRSVYRHGGNDACREDATPVAGDSTYTIGKIAMTQLARWIGAAFGRRWVELRYALPFAPYHVHPKVDLFLQGKMYANAPSSIQQRTYITDLIHQTLKALEFARPEGDIFNATLLEVRRLAEVAQIGARVAGVEPEPATLAPDDPTQRGHWIDPEKTARLLGASRVSLEEGLRRYLRARREDVLEPRDWMFAEE